MPTKRSKAKRSGFGWCGSLLLAAMCFHLGQLHSAPPIAREISATAPTDKYPSSAVSFYRYDRKRGPFYGWFQGVDQLQMFKILSHEMRWQFTFNGTIAVNDGTAILPGGKRPPASFATFGGQVYAPLNERRDLFGRQRDGRIIWTKELVNFLVAEVAAGRDISCKDYPRSALDVADAFRFLNLGPKDKLLVGGSISPWIEAVALHQGIGKVVTTDYNDPICNACHPRLGTISMDKLMQKTTRADYTHIISYSAIEHDGLGRYGDPLDPWGDMHAMREFWSLLGDGGILLLAVPLWAPDQLCQLLARLYGPIRLPWLVRGWEYMGTVNHGYFSTATPFSAPTDPYAWGWHPIIILRKRGNGILPTDDLSTCTMNCTNHEAAQNKWLSSKMACRPSNNCGDVSKAWSSTLKMAEKVQSGVVNTWKLPTAAATGT